MLALVRLARENDPDLPSQAFLLLDDIISSCLAFHS